MKKTQADETSPIESFTASIEEKYGKGSITNSKVTFKCPSISTGSISLDEAIGIGGIPKGRITEIYGPESGGKTTLALQCIAEAHKTPNSQVCYVDVEHALDLGYAKALGVDLDRLHVSQPGSGEEALDIYERACKAGFAIVVLDSVAALCTRAELDGEMEEANMGGLPKLMGRALRKIVPACSSEPKTACIFINQIRMKIGIVYGNPEVQPGGRALPFAASLRLDVRPKKADDTIRKTEIKLVKNKVGNPFTKIELDLEYGKGFSKTGDLLDLATERRIVQRSGTWYNYGETRLGQGRDAAKLFLGLNEGIYNEIDSRTRASKAD